jgi:hypothetical protein
LYQGRNYKTKFSVMFWGCISYSTVFRSSAFRMSSIRRWTFVFITFHTFSIIFKSGLCGGHSKVGISFSVFHWFVLYKQFRWQFMAGHCPTFSYKPLHIPGGQCPMPCVSEDKSVENGKWYSNFRVWNICMGYILQFKISRLPWMSSQNGRRHFNVCVPSREKLVFHTEINNKTYIRLDWINSTFN